jgi:hypothetical protein
MTWALIRKELRDLLPWGLLCLVLGALDLIPELLAQLDMRPFATTMSDFLEGANIVSWLFAFAIATGITTREQDDRTLAFLDGLPVSRARVFLVKCGVTALMVMLAPLASFLVILLEHFLSRGSLDHDLRPWLLMQLLGMQLLLICNGVALGAAIGRLRALTWLTVGSVVLALQYLGRDYPRVEMLNPLSLLESPLNSAGLAIDAQAAWVQAALTAVGFGIAWYAFSRAARPRNLPTVPRPLLGALLTTATVIVVGTAFALWFDKEVETYSESEPNSEETPSFVPSAPAQTATRHYEFSYPADRSAVALQLADRADAIFERVHQLLGIPPGATIAVDASGSVRNTLGTAFFGRIRLQLDEDPLTTLAHETAHVVARRVAGNTAASLWQKTTVLDEGLATWIERRFTTPAADDTGLFALGTLHARRELLTAELFDEDLFSALRGPEIKYPAGAALVEATVRLYGEQALLRLLRAFADARLPKDLGGETLWQATFQLAGMDLAAVVDEFYREIAAYAKQHAAEIAELPRVRVRLVTYQDAIGVQPLLDVESDAELELQLRFKPEPDSTLDLLEGHQAQPFEPVFREDFQIAGGQVCVQAGVVRASHVLYESWVCLPTSDAVEWSPPAAAESGEPAATAE